MKAGPRILLPSEFGRELVADAVAAYPGHRATWHLDNPSPETIQFHDAIEDLHSRPDAWTRAASGDQYFGFRVGDVVGRGRYSDETVEELYVPKEAPSIRTIILGREIDRHSRAAGNAYSFYPAALVAALRDAGLAFKKVDPRPACEHCHMEMMFSEGVFSCPKP